MKNLIISLGVVFIAFIGIILYVRNTSEKRALHIEQEERISEIKEQQKLDSADLALYNSLKIKADSAKSYCQAQNLNTDYCILVDFKIPSGKYRFFLWSFAKDSIVIASLCSHGYGGGSTTSTPIFSNEESSNCTSLGHYKIGKRTNDSPWKELDILYYLVGLDESNSNAEKRRIALYSYRGIPETEIYPREIPLGWSQGSPLIANHKMQYLDSILKNMNKPALLWVYY